MPIRFFCPSGHRLSAPESQQGKLIRCPACKQAAIVPTVKVEDLLEKVAGEALGEAPRPAAQPPVPKPDPAPQAPAPAPPAAAEEGVVFEEVVESPWADSPAAEGTSGTGDSDALREEGPSPSRAPAPPPLPARNTVGPAQPGELPEPSSSQPWSDEEAPPRSPPAPTAEREAGADEAPIAPKSTDGQAARGTRGGQAARGARSERGQPAGRTPRTLAARPPSRTRRSERLIGPDVAPPDPARVEATKWLALWLGLIVLFSVGPAVMHLNLAASPGWARTVLLLAAMEAAYVVWMRASPDWSSAWVLMLVFAAGATLSATATGAALVTPRDQPMPLGLGEIRTWAAAWFGAVLAVQGLGAYLAGRMSIRWHNDSRAARLRSFVGQTATPASLPFSRRACSP